MINHTLSPQYCKIMLVCPHTEEDTFGSYSRLLLKYFLSEGVMCGHALFVASASEKGEDVLKVDTTIYKCIYSMYV